MRGVHGNEKVPVAGSIAPNTCPPEEVVDILIEGVGQGTGARYSVPTNETDEITITGVPPAFSEEFDLRYRLIREGSLDNLWLRVTFTLTIPPGTEDVRRFEIECRG